MRDGRYISESIFPTPVLLNPKLHLGYQLPVTQTGRQAVLFDLFAGYTFSSSDPDLDGFYLAVSNSSGTPIHGFFAGSRVGFAF